MLWRYALLAAARNLRQNILHGCIWYNTFFVPEQEQEQERGRDCTPFGTALCASSSSSSPLDLPLTGGDAEPALSAVERNDWAFPISSFHIHFSKRICELFGFVYF